MFNDRYLFRLIPIFLTRTLSYLLGTYFAGLTFTVAGARWSDISWTILLCRCCQKVRNHASQKTQIIVSMGIGVKLCPPSQARKIIFLQYESSYCLILLLRANVRSCMNTLKCRTHLQRLDEFLALQGCGACFVQLVIMIEQLFLDTNLGSFAVPTNSEAVQSTCDLVKTLVRL